MSTRLERLFARTAGQRKWRLGAIIAGVIIVPLAVGGFVAGAIGHSGSRTDTIPAIVVNNDTMVSTSAADGSKQQVLAGRQLVTQLTGSGSKGFDWTISNSSDARSALDSGSAYAVLTIPKDFSKSVTSISGNDPKRAELGIRTDDSHSYLAGSVAQSVGTAMTSTFGKQITSQYLSGLYAGMAGMGSSLADAAKGANSLADGTGQLATGLDGLSSGVSQTNTGAAKLSDGVATYTGGVDSLAGGLQSLKAGSGSLDQISTGVSGYVKGTNAVLGALDTLAASDPAAAALVKSPQLAPVIAGLKGNGGVLASQTATGIDGIQSGIAQSADGAQQLSAGSGGLRDGAASLSSGTASLASGAAKSASAAHSLQSGATKLAGGLSTGAEQVPTQSAEQQKKTASIVADPVHVSVTRDNSIGAVGSVIGMVLVPLGLWIGALAIFLLLKPVTSAALASTATSGRILARSFTRALGLAASQAVGLTLLLHGALGIAWTMLPATLAFSLLLAVVFTAIHYLLSVAFGRVGIVVSIVLLALQLTAIPGLVPLQVIGEPFQVIAPFLPMTYAVNGMQGIVSGVGGATVAAPAVLLLVVAALCMLVSLWVIARKRGARSFGFAVARGEA